MHVESDVTLERFEARGLSWDYCSRRRHIPSSFCMTVRLRCWYATDVIVMICSGSCPIRTRNEAKFCIYLPIEMFEGWPGRSLWGVSLRLPCFFQSSGLLFAVGLLLPFLTKCLYLFDGEFGLFCGVPDRSGVRTFRIFIAIVVAPHVLPCVVDILETVFQNFAQPL